MKYVNGKEIDIMRKLSYVLVKLGFEHSISLASIWIMKTKSKNRKTEMTRRKMMIEKRRQALFK